MKRKSNFKKNLYNIRKYMGDDIVSSSIALVFVRVITMLVGIVQTMILSRTLTKADYGTYSQALLIISFAVPFFSLGLENAVNYFFNKSAETASKEKFINTIFTVSIFSGILCGMFMIGFRNQIAGYFKNTAILGLIFWIAFRPCLQNLISLYQPLYISSGYTGTIAGRNLIISIVQIGIVGGISCFSNNIRLIFILLLLLDMIQFFWFAEVYRKRKFAVSIFEADFSLVREILKYAFPMLFAASLSTISLNIDKLMVSGFMSTEDYALYANVSKELPFAFIVSSFTAVVTPLIVQYISSGEYEKFKNLWSSYLEVGYKVTWPLCIGAAILAPEMIEVLYSAAYLSNDGVIVFCIYTVASMMRFTYFGMVPTALGRTDIVLKYSVISCAINICLNYPMYLWLGMPGPAAATVISLIISAVLYFRTSAKLVNISFWEVLIPKKIICLFTEMGICGVTVRLLVSLIGNFCSNAFVKWFPGYFLFNALIFGWNYKGLKSLLGTMRERN